MKYFLQLFPPLVLASQLAMADVVPFNLSVQNSGLDMGKTLELSDLGEGKTRMTAEFKDPGGKAYSLDLNYKALPANRSYPGNLDITLKDAQGNKLAYLFFAINDVGFLKRMGKFGIIADDAGEPVDIKFVFDPHAKGGLRVASLGDERFMQDVLAPVFDFQMIRPVLLPMAAPGERSRSFPLDHHPYEVRYTLKDLDDGRVEFQYDLYRSDSSGKHLLLRIYFDAGDLETLREAMFAGKYFDKTNGAFKLVFYPAMGQIQPAKRLEPTSK